MPTCPITSVRAPSASATWSTDAAELVGRRPDVAIVGAPFDDAVSRRSGARFGPRAIRQATYGEGAHSLQLDIEPWQHLDVVDAGDANIAPAWLEREPRDDLSQGPRGRRLGCRAAHPGRRPLDHLAVGDGGGDGRRTADASASSTSTHTPTPPPDQWGVLGGHGTPMRRLIESGAVKGKNFVQVGLRGYWPGPDVFAWMRDAGHALAQDDRDRGARRGGRHRRRHRRGARRPGHGLPVARHRRRRPGHGPRHGYARAGRHAHARAAARGAAHRRHASTWRPWTSSRSRRRTTTPRSRPRPRIGRPSRRSARWPSRSATAARPPGRLIGPASLGSALQGHGHD